MEEPCSGWNPETALCEDWASVPAAVQSYALNFAKTILWAATGRRFGLCEVTVRPCFRQPLPLYVEFQAVGFWGLHNEGTALAAAYYENLGCACGPSCHCSNTRLPLLGPVASVVEVQIDADVVDPGDYRLDGNTLVREDGEGWPTSQNLTEPIGGTSTFAITYERGETVPTLLNQAAGIYACEVAKSRLGRACSLPKRVRTITRQGVTIEFVGTDDYLKDGLTGVAEIDELIMAYNPYRLRDRPRVLSLDTPHLR
jgi:hypothetical protein